MSEIEPASSNLLEIKHPVSILRAYRLDTLSYTGINRKCEDPISKILLPLILKQIRTYEGYSTTFTTYPYHPLDLRSNLLERFNESTVFKPETVLRESLIVRFGHMIDEIPIDIPKIKIPQNTYILILQKQQLNISQFIANEVALTLSNMSLHQLTSLSNLLDSLAHRYVEFVHASLVVNAYTIKYAVSLKDRLNAFHAYSSSRYPFIRRSMVEFDNSQFNTDLQDDVLLMSLESVVYKIIEAAGSDEYNLSGSVKKSDRVRKVAQILACEPSLVYASLDYESIVALTNLLTNKYRSTGYWKFFRPAALVAYGAYVAMLKNSSL